MPNPELLPLSRITIHGVTYEIKDAAARRGQTYHLATEASNTPAGVVWIDTSTTPQTTITGTLAAWDTTIGASGGPRQGVYLVPDNLSNEAQDIYGEWVAVSTSSTPTSATTIWEKIGDTSINWDELLRHLVATVNPSTTSVLGANTVLQNAASTTSMQYGTEAGYVKSYPGVTANLDTTTIKGVGNNITFNAVSTDPGSESIHNILLGTDTSASAITTANVTATDTKFDDPTTASKATPGTNIENLAKKGSTFTNIASFTFESGVDHKVIQKAHYDTNTETLIFDDIAVGDNTITGVLSNDTATITPYTFQDVTVPVVESNTSKTFKAVDTNISVTVPVVSSDDTVSLSKPITLASKTAATAAAQATTVAVGTLSSQGTGGTIMTGLGTPTTGTVVNTLGTGANTANGTAAAQNITIVSGATDVLNSNTTVTLSTNPNPVTYPHSHE